MTTLCVDSCPVIGGANDYTVLIVVQYLEELTTTLC